MKNSLWSVQYLLWSCCLIGASGCKSQTAVVPAQDMQPIPQSQVVQNPPLSLQDIVNMTQQKTNPALIINQIKATGSTYVLSAEQILWLKQQGVDDNVILCMQSSGGAPPPPAAYARPVVAGPAYVAPGAVMAPPPVVVAPYPYYGGWGYGYGYRRY